MLVAATLVVFPFCMLFASISDLLSMTIANRVSIILLVAFAVLAPLTGMDWTTYGWHFLAGALVLCVTFTLFALGGIGGGDAKLMTATAVWMGFGPLLLEYLINATFLGGLLTVGILLFRKSPFAVLYGGNVFLRNFTDQVSGVPYGIALGVAGLMVYPKTAVVVAALQQMVSP
ncbi:MAG: prepilin peptidase [Rhizobiales bacterium]|nr:prepilin peptidase [Hyphomicrobiales bacterium]